MILAPEKEKSSYLRNTRTSLCDKKQIYIFMITQRVSVCKLQIGGLT